MDISLSNYARVIVGSFHFFFWLKEVYFFMVSAVHIYLSLPELEPGSLASLELLCAAAKSEEEGGGVGGRGCKKNCTQNGSARTRLTLPPILTPLIVPRAPLSPTPTHPLALPASRAIRTGPSVHLALLLTFCLLSPFYLFYRSLWSFLPFCHFIRRVCVWLCVFVYVCKYSPFFVFLVQLA